MDLGFVRLVRSHFLSAGRSVVLVPAVQVAARASLNLLWPGSLLEILLILLSAHDQGP
jgi:hypothetical protein